MKRLAHLSALSLVLLLAACGGWKTLTYDAVLDADSASRKTELLQALERVTERRLRAKSIDETVITATPKDENGLLTISGIKSKEQSELIGQALLEPFDFTVRLEVSPEEGSEATESTWVETGIDGANLQWIDVIQQESTGAIGAELLFNDAAREKFAAVFAENKNGTLGIFVRELLVSKLAIGSSELKERIVINNIPSAAIAEVFADDVNVGLHTQLIKR